MHAKFPQHRPAVAKVTAADLQAVDAVHLEVGKNVGLVVRFRLQTSRFRDVQSFAIEIWVSSKRKREMLNEAVCILTKRKGHHAAKLWLNSYTKAGTRWVSTGNC